MPIAKDAHEPVVAPDAILEGLPDAVVAVAEDGRIVYANLAAEALFGWPREDLVGRLAEALWPGRLRRGYRRNVARLFAGDPSVDRYTEAVGLRRDGSEFVGEMRWGVVRTGTGPLLVVTGRDVSERRAAESRLRAVAAMGERALAGADPTELATEAVALLRTRLPIAGAHVRQAGGALIASDGAPGADLRLSFGAGELLVVKARPLTGEERSIVRAVATTLGTALARWRDEERMRHDALHDPLTGLANRTLLHDRLAGALARSRREDGTTALLFLDLDGFKRINDVHGHAAGDAVLVEIGRRLLAAVRPSDTVTRMGGDEFVVVCDDVDEETAVALARRLEAVIDQPITVDDTEHRLSASIGIALGHDDADELLRAADAAAYDAKGAGGGRIVVAGA